jgi:hypothetical protein
VRESLARRGEAPGDCSTAPCPAGRTGTPCCLTPGDLARTDTDWLEDSRYGNDLQRDPDVDPTGSHVDVVQGAGGESYQ